MHFRCIFYGGYAHYSSSLLLFVVVIYAPKKDVDASRNNKTEKLHGTKVQRKTEHSDDGEQEEEEVKANASVERERKS